MFCPVSDLYCLYGTPPLQEEERKEEQAQAAQAAAAAAAKKQAQLSGTSLSKAALARVQQAEQMLQRVGGCSNCCPYPMFAVAPYPSANPA